MEILHKAKETFISVLPIVITVLVLNFTIVPMSGHIGNFLIGALLIIIGLTLFLAGTEIGLIPVGEKFGEKVFAKRNLPLLLFLGFVVGFCVTYAEPDVSILCQQINKLNPDINPTLLRLFIAIGLAFFLDLGLYSILKKTKIKHIFLYLYLLIIFGVIFLEEKMAGMAFDASGSTTGPLAVPFIIALGLGISSSTKKGDVDGFGLTGIASVGPIVAVMLMSFGKSSSNISDISDGIHIAHSLGNMFRNQFYNVTKGFVPLVIFIILLQIFLIKFPRIKFKNTVLGIVYSFIGIILFLTGAEYGFMDVGRIIGKELFVNNKYLYIFIAFIFGLFTCLSEPAVWVLTDQVEEVTSGRIGKKMVLIFLCVGVSLSVVLAVVRLYFLFSYKYYVYFGIGLALLLSFFCPDMFTSLAFDSGGVASGPMSTTFILSFVSGGAVSSDMAFGVIGLIAIAPMISIQLLGIIYHAKELKVAKEKQQLNLRGSNI